MPDNKPSIGNFVFWFYALPIAAVLIVAAISSIVYYVQLIIGG
jgi:hypothetical protein